jgi:hypothetical protein
MNKSKALDQARKLSLNDDYEIVVYLNVCSMSNDYEICPIYRWRGDNENEIEVCRFFKGIMD